MNWFIIVGLVLIYAGLTYGPRKAAIKEGKAIGNQERLKEFEFMATMQYNAQVRTRPEVTVFGVADAIYRAGIAKGREDNAN